MSNDNLTPQQTLANLTQGVSLCSEVPLFNIDNQGHWQYLNSPLPLKFAKLFSSILNRQNDEYFLTTPVEKVKVCVANVALIIVDYDVNSDGSFVVRTSIDTEFTVNGLKDFAITEEGVFTVLGKGLEAELGRACYYRFVNEFIDIS